MGRVSDQERRREPGQVLVLKPAITGRAGRDRSVRLDGRANNPAEQGDGSVQRGRYAFRSCLHPALDLPVRCFA